MIELLILCTIVMILRQVWKHRPTARRAWSCPNGLSFRRCKCARKPI